MRMKSCVAIAAFAAASWVWTMESQAAMFYGIRANGTLIKVDTTAQTVTTQGTLPFGPSGTPSFEDLEFDGSGNLYAMRGYNDGNFPPTNFNQAYRVLNPVTGTAILTGTFDNSTSKRHANIAFRASNGLFYGNRNSDGHLGTLNVTTGAFNDISGVSNGLRTYVEALAFHPTTGQAYAIVDLGLSIFGQIDFSLIRIDLGTGLGTTVGSLGQGSASFKALRFDENGTAYTLNFATGDVFTVSTTTGAASFAFAGGAAAVNTTGLALIVPSPAGASLLVLGALVSTRRRRR